MSLLRQQLSVQTVRAILVMELREEKAKPYSKGRIGWWLIVCVLFRTGQQLGLVQFRLRGIEMLWNWRTEFREMDPYKYRHNHQAQQEHITAPT